jgi:hypothetical protein
VLHIEAMFRVRWRRAVFFVKYFVSIVCAFIYSIYIDK